MHEPVRADDEDTGEIPVPDPCEVAQLAPEPELDAEPALTDEPRDADPRRPSDPTSRTRTPTTSRAARASTARPPGARRSSVPSWDDIMFGAKRD